MATDPVALAFETDSGTGPRARLGLIVLETDQTVENEMRGIQLDGVDWFHSRIPNSAEVTHSTLTDMEDRLPVAAGLLPREFDFDAIGYACTSAATLIGEQGVTRAIQTAHPGVPCTNPISAAVSAFGALTAQRIAVVTPYTAAVTAPIVGHFGASGVDVVGVGSFLEPDDFVVGRISPESISAAVRFMVRDERVDAVFVSCTSLRTFGIIEDLEAALDRPVVSSNSALLWKLLRLAGVDDLIDGLGELYSR